MKIRLLFNEKNFEYDVYHLIRAFYPRAELETGYVFDAAPHAGNEKASSGSGGMTHDDSSAKNRDSETSVDLIFRVNYEPDRVTFSAAGPGAAQFAGGIRESSALPLPRSRREDKNCVKRLVYSVLNRITGKVLPWGDLTGIRPTKLVMEAVESGMPQEEVIPYLERTYLIGEEKAALALEIVNCERRLLDSVNYRRGYSLYVDVPFCPSICLYCTFGSHPIDAWSDYVDPYFQALYRELEFIAESMRDRELNTVYIGGGTPTSVSARQLRDLLEKISGMFPLEQAAEFTVEGGRPDTITEEKLEVLRQFPVTRISINPQTMNQKTLDLIGRRHTAEDTEQKFRLARKMGFDNINMDIIVGLPGEGASEISHTLQEIQRLGPDSLTVHSLALKRASRLNLLRDRYGAISFENSEAIMKDTENAARAMNMHPYYLYRQKNMAGNFENTGYAAEGCECLYNILIMEERQPIIAAGCGASTKIVHQDGRKTERVENVKDLQNYIDRVDEMIERKRKRAAAGTFL